MQNYNWFASELHCHTCHSDGTFTPQSLLETAAMRHLDGIALTDHNTMSGCCEAESLGVLPVLKGMEWTTYFGHMPVLDAEQFVDWRDATPQNIDEKTREVKKQGGLVGMAHPFQLGTPICTGGHWDFKVQDFSLVDYIEIFSEGNPFLNAANKQAICLWHSLLDLGYHLAPTFGRDWHNGENDLFPSACTYLGAPCKTLTAAQMKEAVRKGRTSVSVGPLFYAVTENGKTVGETVRSGTHRVTLVLDDSRMQKFDCASCIQPKTIRIVTNGGTVVAEFPITQRETALLFAPHHWYSFELWGKNGRADTTLLAVTSPIYTEK